MVAYRHVVPAGLRMGISRMSRGRMIALTTAARIMPVAAILVSNGERDQIGAYRANAR